MSLYVGRVDLVDTATLSRSRGALSITGDYIGASAAATALMRENIVWLEGTIVPVTWSEDSTVDGFYRVVSCAVSYNPITVASYVFSYSIELEALPHHRAAEIEASCVGADRTNEPGGGVTPVPWYAVPNEAVAVNYATGSITTDTRVGPGGTAFVMTGAGFYSRYARWTIAAGSYLNMAPKVQIGGVTVVGRQSTLTPFDVTLDNGIVKIGQATGTNSFQATFPAATASSWGTPFGWDVGWWDGVSAVTVLDPDAFYAARITRNDPQVCSVRWSWEASGLITHVDISLRRGAVVAEVVCSQESAYTNVKWAIQSSATTTAHTSRSSRSSTVEDNYQFILSDAICTKDAGALYIDTASDQSRFGIGVILEGGSSTSENDTASVRDQFFAAQQITERFSGVRQ
jgi:hypothetical protein